MTSLQSEKAKGHVCAFGHCTFAPIANSRNCEDHTKNPAAVALGSIKSEKKAKTARENGLKGGRPRKWDEIAIHDPITGDTESFPTVTAAKAAARKLPYTPVFIDLYDEDGIVTDIRIDNPGKEVID